MSASSKSKTKHEKLSSFRNNDNYLLIGDQDRKVYHRKECPVLDSESVRKQSIIPLKYSVGKGWKPCPDCEPVLSIPEKREKTKNPLGEQLRCSAEKYGMKAELIGNYIYITTICDEWYFDFQASPIILHHKNRDRRTDGKGEPLKDVYHRQPNKFDTPFQALIYIWKHTESIVKYEVNPTVAQLRLEDDGTIQRLFCGDKALPPRCTITALFPSGWQEIEIKAKENAAGSIRWYIATPSFSSYSPVGLFVKPYTLNAGNMSP